MDKKPNVAQLTLHLPWVWALYPSTGVPFIRVLHRGFELRIQHWPHQPFNNTRWDMLDGARSSRAFGYCDSIEDAEHFVMAMAAIYRDRLLPAASLP